MLDKQFGSVFIHEVDRELPEFESRTNARLHAENIASAITREKVTKFLARLCPNKSIGADGVHPSVLCYCAEALAPALVHIFKLSIAEGRIPDKWKLAYITGIFRKL